MDDNTGRRELVISFGAGLFFANDTVVIIHVWHSKENRL